MYVGKLLFENNMYSLVIFFIIDLLIKFKDLVHGGLQ